MKVQFQGAGGEVFELVGTVAGKNHLLLSAQGHAFPIPANLNGSIIVYRSQKAVSVADVLSELNVSIFYVLYFVSYSLDHVGEFFK